MAVAVILFIVAADTIASVLGLRGRVALMFLIVGISDEIVAVCDYVTGFYPGSVGAALGGTLALWGWWIWTRRKRKRAQELLGAKSKALRDALVRTLRESLKPRPVLRPVPEGR